MGGGPGSPAALRVLLRCPWTIILPLLTSDLLPLPPAHFTSLASSLPITAGSPQNPFQCLPFLLKLAQNSFGCLQPRASFDTTTISAPSPQPHKDLALIISSTSLISQNLLDSKHLLKVPGTFQCNMLQIHSSPALLFPQGTPFLLLSPP